MKNILVLTFALIFMAAIQAPAAAFNVATTVDAIDAVPGDGVCADSFGRCTLRAAITESNLVFGTDTIFIPAGTYTQTVVAAGENNNAGGDWDLIDNVAITSPGCILQAALTAGVASERVLDIVNPSAQVAIYNVTVRYGKAPETGSERERAGGGIRSAGILYLYNVSALANAGYTGGGIYADGPLQLEVSTVKNNSCYSSESSCFGGGIYAYPRAGDVVQLIGTVVENNVANPNTTRRGYGGGMYVRGQGAFALNIAGGRFKQNVGGGSGSRGAGLAVFSTAGAASVNINNNAVFTENSFNATATGVSGAGIYLEAGGSSTVTGTWDRLNMSRNAPDFSAATRSTKGGHVAISAGGNGVNLNIRNSNFFNARAFYGGALHVTSLSFAPAILNVTNSSFSANRVDDGDPQVINEGDGGGVYFERGAESSPTQATFNFCTFSRNVGFRGTAIFNTPGGAQVILKNSVIDYHGGSGGVITGPVTSNGYNHFEAPPGANVAIKGSDVVGYTGLVPSSNAEYYVPLPDSPVLNMIPNGVNGCGAAGGGVTTDQLLKPRPYNGACDKGAIELQSLGQGGGPF